jgi:hypothetical protein
MRLLCTLIFLLLLCNLSFSQKTDDTLTVNKLRQQLIQSIDSVNYSEHYSNSYLNNYSRTNSIDNKKYSTGRFKRNICETIDFISAAGFVFGTAGLIFAPKKDKITFGIPLECIAAVGYISYFWLQNKWKSDISYFYDHKLDRDK